MENFCCQFCCWKTRVLHYEECVFSTLSNIFGGKSCENSFIIVLWQGPKCVSACTAIGRHIKCTVLVKLHLAKSCLLMLVPQTTCFENLCSVNRKTISMVFFSYENRRLDVWQKKNAIVGVLSKGFEARTFWQIIKQFYLNSIYQRRIQDSTKHLQWSLL